MQKAVFHIAKGVVSYSQKPCPAWRNALDLNIKTVAFGANKQDEHCYIRHSAHADYV